MTYNCATQKRRGFTLIETMVAITIITVAVAGPLVTASRAIVAAQNARDQLIASYLAQEGVEYIRAARDDGFLNNPSDSDAAWDEFLTAVDDCIPTPADDSIKCTYDPLELPDSPLAVYSGLAPLYLTPGSGTRIYTQQSSSGNDKTVFTRTIQVREVSRIVGKEVSILSTVWWDFHGTRYHVDIADYITSWQ